MIKKRLKGLLSLVLSTIMLLALFPAMQVSAEDIYVEMYLNTSTAYAVGTTVDSLTKLTESAYAESTPASTFTAEYLQQNLAS
ncbi:MAG: hypothetical protein IJ305_00740, partial [Oscillospiraceae bacterium]|nr:hypothetical protein [Oscillospiraceae bacterium]